MDKTAYHPHTNGKTEPYNKTIFERLRNFVYEHQANWYKSVQPFTYAYNTQMHSSTNFIPFSLVLSIHPPVPTKTEYATVLPTDFTTYMPANKLRLRLLSRFYFMKSKIEENLTNFQRRYKKYFNRVMKCAPSIEPLMEVYIYKSPPSVHTQSEFLSWKPVQNYIIRPRLF